MHGCGEAVCGGRSHEVVARNEPAACCAGRGARGATPIFFVILHRQTVWDPAVMDTSITNELNPTSHRAGSDSHFEPAGMGSLEYYFSFSVMLQFKQAAYHLPIYLL